MRSGLRGQSLAFLAVATATLAACVDAPSLQAGVPKIVEKLLLAPYAEHEECVSLVRGDRLDYRFDSDVPISFDIRYRDANVVVMPITREGVNSDSGVFAPAISQNYCLWWEAGAQGATIGYRVALRKGRS